MGSCTVAGRVLRGGCDAVLRTLGEGSAAIDVISEVECVDAENALLTTDQRGLPRPVPILGPEPKCDVGAFERQPQQCEVAEFTCREVQRVEGDDFGSGCQDSIAFFDQLRGDHHLHRHPKLHRTTLCVSGPRNQRSRALSEWARCLSFCSVP